jgi:hypothetical protein
MIVIIVYHALPIICIWERVENPVWEDFNLPLHNGETSLITGGHYGHNRCLSW